MEEIQSGTAPEERMTELSGIRRRWENIPYGTDSPSQRLDVLLPDAGSGSFPVLVYIHGGGFFMGDKCDYHLAPYLTALTRGWAVAPVEYRLSGEALFPAAVLDVRQAVRFLRSHAAEYGLDPERFAAIGGSAGGNLAVMLAMNIPVFPGETAGLPLPRVSAAVDQFGPVDFRAMDAQARANGVSFVDHDAPDSPESRYIGKPVGEASDADCLPVQPLTYASGAMAPLLIQHGTRDRMVPFAQSGDLASALASRGLPVSFMPIPDADHDDPAFFTDGNMKIILDFIDNCFKKETCHE